MCCVVFGSLKTADNVEQLGPGRQVLYTWQNPLGKRELRWSAGKEKNQTNDLVKVGLIQLYAY